MMSVNDDSGKKTFTRWDAETLDEVSLKKAYEDVQETDESRVNGLQQLREKLREVSDLNPCLDESFLLAYLRVAKFDVSKAFQRIIKYYRQQEKFPRHFSPDELRKARDLSYYWISPYRTKDNAILFINKHGLVDPSEMPIDLKFYSDILGVEPLIQNPITQLRGIVVLQDYSTFNFTKLKAHSVGVIKKYLDLWQGSYPLRMKEIHLIQESRLLSLFVKIAFPLLSHKLQKRIFVHSKFDNWKSLHAAIPPEILPEEYGGHLKQSEIIPLLENVEDLDQQFKQKLKFGFVDSQQQT